MREASVSPCALMIVASRVKAESLTSRSAEPAKRVLPAQIMAKARLLITLPQCRRFSALYIHLHSQTHFAHCGALHTSMKYELEGE